MVDSTFLDWPFLDDTHRQLVQDLRVWTAQQVAPLEEPGHDLSAVDEHCRHLVRLLGDAGWLKYCVPGVNGFIGVRNLCLCRETLGYTSGLADFAFAMQGLGTGPISLYGSDEQKRRYLPPVAEGKAIAAFAISEPNAGSDVGAMTTAAVAVGADYVINGSKTWISNAGLADHYVVFARTGGAPGPRGLSAFIVDADNPGLRVSERIPVSAPHPLGTIRLEDCRVPATAMLSKPGDGFKIAMATLDIFRSSVGAASLGFARRAFDEAIRQSKKRVVFGKHLSEYQLTQVKLADMAVSIDAAALLIYRAAWTKDRNPGGRVTREAAMAKLYATEEAQKVIDQAVQIFGGMGVVSGVVVEGLYREIRSLRIYEGTSEIQKLIIAATVLAEDQ
ncbi:MAG: acyl-CoA dehydrogenase [Gammaproteobacteria bacterium RIFCSPLOWO2_02_FULL_56_15]|nr:MAG: acyl-CoA dehydrogenase [Gammaproteobacteria bacterium RIFCSPLOWO2_02_FULL_56_15]